MAMDAGEIERMIKAKFPDAKIEIRDLAGDGDHYAAHVVSSPSRARPGCSSTRWCTRRSAAAWAACCTRSH